MRNFIITEEQLSAITKYLATKSYAEVAPIFEVVKRLKLVNLVEEKPNATQVQETTSPSTAT